MHSRHSPPQARSATNMLDLLHLDQCRLIAPRHCTGHVDLSEVSLPLLSCPPAWHARLTWHLDQAFINYILSGIQYRFRLGFNYSRPLSLAKRNMPSALQHTDVVDHYIQSERAEGRFLGPLVPANVLNLHTSRMGVIHKGRMPRKWRFITDLSFPEGTSVNDGIDSEPCSLQYTSVEKIAKVAYQFGPQTLLAKVEIKAAYCLVPVYPDDHPLHLGVVWQTYRRYTPVRCIHQHGMPFIDHYLDDFIIVGPLMCALARALAVLEEECVQLGVPLAPEKKEGSSTCITFLGFQIDTELGQLSLPQEKLTHLKQDIKCWLPRRKCRKQELDSLIGTLQYAAKVIHLGRSFVQRLIELQKHDHCARSSLYKAACTSASGSSLVEGLRRTLERNNILSCTYRSGTRVRVRCVGLMGVRCMVRHQVVAA